jgi:hypothetical protein
MAAVLGTLCTIPPWNSNQNTFKYKYLNTCMHVDMHVVVFKAADVFSNASDVEEEGFP